jgi:hypothetical protein
LIARVGPADANMSVRFIRSLATTSLIGKRITLRTWPLYFFDLLGICAIVGAVSACKDLSLFSKGAPSVTVFADDMTLIGCVGIYGFRIAQYIAIARQGRMPQIAEWCVTLAGLGLLLVSYVFAGALLDGYAGLHGYKYCSANPDYSFVKSDLDCPIAQTR